MGLMLPSPARGDIMHNRMQAKRSLRWSDTPLPSPAGAALCITLKLKDPAQGLDRKFSFRFVFFFCLGFVLGIFISYQLSFTSYQLITEQAIN
jgi:hypothetical protein